MIGSRVMLLEMASFFIRMAEFMKDSGRTTSAMVMAFILIKMAMGRLTRDSGRTMLNLVKVKKSGKMAPNI